MRSWKQPPSTRHESCIKGYYKEKNPPKVWKLLVLQGLFDNQKFILEGHLGQRHVFMIELFMILGALLRDESKSAIVTFGCWTFHEFTCCSDRFSFTRMLR